RLQDRSCTRRYSGRTCPSPRENPTHYYPRRNAVIRQNSFRRVDLAGYSHGNAAHTLPLVDPYDVAVRPSFLRIRTLDRNRFSLAFSVTPPVNSLRRIPLFYAKDD